MTTERHVVLTFVRFGDALHVLGSPDATWTGLRPLGSFTPDWDGVDAASLTVRHLVEHAADAGEFSVAAVEELRRTGTWLFDELLPRGARQWLRDDEGLLTLHLDPALLHIPWELLHTSREFVSLRWALGRVVAADADTSIQRPLEGARRSALVIADPAEHLVEAFNEGQILRDVLVEHDEVAVDLRATCVDADLLRRHVRDYDILHFAGHIDREGWQMDASRFDASHLDRLAGGAPLPALVFANGCGATAPGDPDDDMVLRWLRGGVRHLLGPLFDVPDRLGRAFAVRFYESLLAGAPIGIAVRDARRLLAEEVGLGTVPWGAYVLYGTPDTVYRPAETVRTVALPEPEPRPTRLSPDGAPVDAEAVRRGGVAVAAALPDRRRTLAGWTPLELLVLALIAGIAAAVWFGLRFEPAFGGF